MPEPSSALVPHPPPTAEELRAAEALVEKHLGFASLREGQAETLARVLRGDDVLGLLPTGGGKSICYQLPAVLGKRVSIVVSPLIALMKDQLDSLPPAMRAAATSLTSELDARELRARLAEIARGRYRLVYVAPERLRSVPLLRALREAGVERLVVDEAHCVSTWGPDFRPDYLALADVRRALGSPQMIAMTATAPPHVLEDIQARLGPLEVVRASIDRPNLRLEAILAKDADEKLGHLLNLCRRTKPPGIVYCSSRAKCDQLAAALRAAGANAEAYHAGLPERSEIQERFMRDEIDILVATVAFGMGVDKGNIRFIFHHDPSASLENYYQEAGRAGRDGNPGRCVALATAADGGQLRSRAKSDLPSLALIVEVWKLVLSGLGEDQYAIVDPEQLDALDKDDVKPRVALSILQEAGAIERLPDAPRFVEWSAEEMTLFDAASRLGVPPERVESALIERGASYRPLVRAMLLKVIGRPERAEDVLEAYAERAGRRGEQMMAYVRHAGCRRAFLRKHFGERDAPATCGNCDRCLGLTPRPVEAADDEADARAVLDALGAVRGIGEQNLVYMLRGDPLAPPWTDGRAGAGALAFRSESKVKQLIRALEGRGLVARETLPNGGVALRMTTEGARRAAAPPEGPLLATRPARAPAADRASSPAPVSPLPPPAPGDARLLEALRAWRRERAGADGVPAYVVAHDSALAAVAAARPRTAEELRAIKGFGPKKTEKYGDDILAIVRADAS